MLSMQNMLNMQIEWIRAMQEGVPFWLKSFLASCNALDSLAFYGAIILVVWMGVSRQRGITLLYLLVFSAMLNLIVKNFYDMPRPFQLEPDIRLASSPGHGFPSGAAQTAMLFGGYLYYHVRKNWALGAAILFILFKSFVRVFIGAHFITDILMGWFVGGSILACYILFGDRLKKVFMRKSALWRSQVLGLSPLWLCLIFFSTSTLRIALMGAFFAIGIYLDEKYNDLLKPPKKFLEGFLRSVATFAQFALILVIVGYLNLPKEIAIACATCILGLWIPWGGTKISLMQKRLFSIK